MPPGGVAARVIALRRNSKNPGELQAQAQKAKKRKAMPLPRPLLVGLSKFDNRREEPHGVDEGSSVKCADDKGNLIGVRACILRHKVKTAEVYSSRWFQYSIAALIFANFFINVLEKQIDPFGYNYKRQFLILEDTFNYIFLCELIINLYAHWFHAFWRSGWNVFDFVVVCVGVLSIARVELPGPLGLLRMLRAFRVFRLFKRIKSLNKIIVSLGNAVPGIANAAFVMLLVMCIYAILAVEFFGQFGVNAEGCTAEDLSNCTYTNYKGVEVDSVTNRQLTYGSEYFGNFLSALLTMFQIMTGESWAEAIARPIFFGWSPFGAALFFISYNVIISFVLVNVVVAVLLEKSMEPEEDQDYSGTWASQSHPGSRRAQSLCGAPTRVAPADGAFDDSGSVLDGVESKGRHSRVLLQPGAPGSRQTLPAESDGKAATLAKQVAAMQAQLDSMAETLRAQTTMLQTQTAMLASLQAVSSKVQYLNLESVCDQSS